MHRARSLPAGPAILLAGLAAAAPAQNAPGYAEALARYEQCLARKPFRYHTDGRDRLAQTRDPAALALLAADYDKVKDYAEYSRYTLATMIGRNFKKEEFVPALAAMRAEHDKPIDTWLWVETLRIETETVGDAAALQLAREAKKVHQRAAAIVALGSSGRGDLKSAILANVAEFPRKESDRMMLLGAMTGALYEQKGRVNTDEYREALKSYISLLSPDVKLTHLAKVQMARHLQWILNAPGMFENPEAWLELLERGDVKTKVDNRTRSQPRFFGIETEGERFCYVVDVSDSMCKEITPEAKPPTVPITGPKEKKKKKRSMELDEGDLPWDKIKTRWDLAREQLRISLSRLTSDKYFSIVLFGTDAEALSATKGMVKATKSNIAAALDELDRIEPIPKDKLNERDRAIAPDGKLKGKTAMHSGLRLAFGLSDKGFVEEQAYVDPEALTEGCDTMFLLSDGAPSWDEFHIVDKDYGEDKVVLDTEYNKEAPRTPQIEYHGPYVHDDWLVEDLRRMNAFRRIRVHCVGLGEANVRLLEQLAKMGNGEVFIVGAKK